MMFKAGLVAVIVANGKIVREINQGGTSTAYLPFNSEYSIRIKNNESRRASVKIEIDGQDVMKNHRLVVDANSESEVKGFLDDSGSVAKNAFRFIEKTSKISKHRGDKINDGIVRIEFQFEEALPQMIPTPVPYPVPYPVPQPYYPRPHPYWYGADHVSINMLRSKGVGGSSVQCSVASNGSDDLSLMEEGIADSLKGIPTNNDAGITVAGSHVNQKFGTTYLRKLESTVHVIVFEIKGAKSDGQPINQPVLARKKVECPTCGRGCKSSNKFCPECSTCLV